MEQPGTSHTGSHMGGGGSCCLMGNSGIMKEYPNNLVEGGAVNLRWCFRCMRT